MLEREFEDFMKLGEEGVFEALEELLKFQPGMVEFHELDPPGWFVRLYAKEHGYDGIIRDYDVGGCVKSGVEFIAFDNWQV